MGLFAKFIGAKKRTHVHAPAGIFPAAPLTNEPVDLDRDSLAFISISKPVWAYGLEKVEGILPDKSTRHRRIAFTQLATPGVSDQQTAHPVRTEDDLGKLARGLPLWLAETLYFSNNYTPLTIIGSVGGTRHTLLTKQWMPQDIHQLVKTAQDGLDYVVTGTLTRTGGEHKLSLDVWDVPKFRNRKSFSSQWTAATADTALSTLHEHFRLFMEWTAHLDGDGLTYKTPARPTVWIETLDASLALFLADKASFDRDQLALPSSVFDLAAEQAFSGETASVAWLTLQDRALRLGKLGAPVPVQVSGTALVKAAQLALA